MAITMSEKIDSREWNDNSVTFTYILKGTSSDIAARTHLLASTSTTYEGLDRTRPELKPVFVDTTNDAGSIWEARVTYVQPDAKVPETGDREFSFDTGGGTEHVVVPKASIARYDEDGLMTNWSRVVGINNDGEKVNGVEIVVPRYTFKETHYLSNATVTDDYKITLSDLTGTVNNDTFKGFAAGEVLFLGASGSKRGRGDWAITFSFAVSRNQTNIRIGVGSHTITVASKLGWDYLWLEFEDRPDSTIHRLIKVPVRAYVDRIYDFADFSNLGIGTT